MIITTETLTAMAHEWAERETVQRQARQAEGKAWSFSSASGSEIEDALRAIPNHDEPYDRYLRIGMAIKNALGDAGESIFDAWARQSSKYNEAEQSKYWRSISSVAKNGSSVTGATIFYEAQAHGWHKANGSGRSSNAKEKEASPAADATEVPSPEYSDDALALEFAALHGHDLRFVGNWNKWFQWRTSRWVEDDTLAIFDMARTICRGAAARLIQRADDPAKVRRMSAALASAKTVAAVTTLSRSDRRIAATVHQWDTDLYTLNTPVGPANLRTGEVRGPNRTDYLTKATAAAPMERPDCPRWIAALGQIFDGDSDLVAFVQRALGYSLTGDVSEQVLFFLLGPGGNGKNVIAETVKGVMGDYATAVPMGLLLEQKHEQHPTEIASLRGARMALVSEINVGQAWAEAKLKSLTGGDRVTARFMRGDFFEFDPTFKFWVRANSRPRLRSVDAAMKRRLCLIPFQVKFEGAAKDVRLQEKLRAEWGGILRWMIDGALAWQRDGLTPPASVSDTTDNYFIDADSFDRWLTELCDRTDINVRTFTRPLFNSWRGWAEQNKERIGSEVEFVDRLEGHGLRRFRTGRGAGFEGIGLLGDPGAGR